MTWKNTTERWGPISQLLHWLILLLILGLGVVGLVMVELPKSPKYFWVYDLHKSFGLTVLVLIALRMIWRLYAGAPRPVAGTPHWQERIATITHGLLYVLVIAVPLSGWLFDSFSGLRPLRWFKLVAVPKLSAPNESYADLAREAHEWLFWILIALITVHAAAAFYHHFFQHDTTLTRMLPRRRPRVAAPDESPASEIHDVP